MGSCHLKPNPYRPSYMTADWFGEKSQRPYLENQSENHDVDPHTSICSLTVDSLMLRAQAGAQPSLTCVTGEYPGATPHNDSLHRG